MQQKSCFWYLLCQTASIFTHSWHCFLDHLLQTYCHSVLLSRLQRIHLSRKYHFICWEYLCWFVPDPLQCARWAIDFGLAQETVSIRANRKNRHPDGAVELLISFLLSCVGSGMRLLAFGAGNNPDNGAVSTPGGVWHEACCYILRSQSTPPQIPRFNTLFCRNGVAGNEAAVCIQKSVKRKDWERILSIRKCRGRRWGIWMEEEGLEYLSQTRVGGSHLIAMTLSCPLLSYGWMRGSCNTIPRLGTPTYRMQGLPWSL